MEEQNTKKYYVGIDLGTNSCGWAVTDEDYNLRRLKGKDAFGARLFKEASDAKGRRTKRTNRRRMARRKFRIELLNSILGPAIENVDPNFLIRLKYSTFDVEDKRKASGKEINSYPLFPTKKQEKEFYKEYPTIWHLRLARIKGDEKAYSDIRYVYLALHHIIKYRGNFLWEGARNPQDDSKLNNVLDDLNLAILNLPKEEEENGNAELSHEKYQQLYTILTNHEGKKSQQKSIRSLLDISDENQKKYWDLFSKAVTGGKFSPLEKDEDDKTSFDFPHLSDDKLPECQEKMGDEFPIIDCAKKIYDFFTLKSLIGEHASEDPRSISASMVYTYNQHKQDLRAAKNALHAIDKKLGQFNAEGSYYYQFFKDPKAEHNYAAYVSVDSSIDRGKNKTNDDSIKEYQTLDKDNVDVIDPEDWKILNAHINSANKDENTFMPLIAHVSTSVIPHQLHENERMIILKNASKYYPSIFSDDTCNKIKQIFEYKIPFYYGPLAGEHSNVIRNDPNNNERITPYNIKDIVNDEKTRTNFRNKLTNNCSRLFGEPVRPKSSLDYEEYIILDRLNKILVNDHELSGKDKEDVLSYILSNGKTTKKNLVRHLALRYGRKDNDIRIAKMDADLPFTASTHAYLKKLGFDLVKDHDLLEDIILLATVYSENKYDLGKVLKAKYPQFSQKQISQLKARKTNKWGSLSRKFLTGLHPIDKDGVINDGTNILEIRRNTNQNLNEILYNSEYHYQDAIKIENDEYFNNTKVDKVQEVLDNTPAIFRRSCYQCLRILDEIKSITKADPEKIFFEVTRQDLLNKDKKKKDSRKEKLQAIYEQLKDLDKVPNVNKKLLLDNLNNSSIVDDKTLRGKHLYLYFMQLGLDLYTGKPIKIEEVLSGVTYDTDHIVPQSLIKDDSLDNLVLVNKKDNQKTKSDVYPIPQYIKTPEVVRLWKYLHEKKRMSDKKYNNLRRSTRLDEKEINGFVNRQINAVDYSNISLKDLVNIIYPNTTVVFSKAQYPSERRKEYHRPKLRELNDAHHARDAYLNIVCGNILSTEFSEKRLPMLYAQKKQEIEHKLADPSWNKDKSTEEKSFNMIKMLERHRVKDDMALAKKCQAVFHKHSALLTYALTYGDPSFYNANATSPKEKKGKYDTLVPIHTDPNSPYQNVAKYGGYDSAGTAYRYLVSYKTKKGKKEKHNLELLNVKYLYLSKYGKDEEALKKQLISDNELQNANDIKFLAKVYNGQKTIYRNSIFMIKPYGTHQISLENIFAIYLDDCFDNKELYTEYLKFWSKHIYLLQGLPIEQSELKVFTDKEQKNERVISKAKSLLILNRIKSISSQKYFLYGFFKKIQDITEEEFRSLSRSNQILALINLLLLFTSPDKAKPGDYISSFKTASFEYKPSLNLKANITLIYDSFTGLYSRQVTYKL